VSVLWNVVLEGSKENALSEPTLNLVGSLVMDHCWRSRHVRSLHARWTARLAIGRMLVSATDVAAVVRCSRFARC